MRTLIAGVLMLAASCAFGQAMPDCIKSEYVGPGFARAYIVNASAPGTYCVFGEGGASIEEAECKVLSPDQPPLTNTADKSKANDGKNRFVEAPAQVAAQCYFDPRPGATLTVTGKYRADNKLHNFSVVFQGPNPRRWMPTFGLLVVENKDAEFFVSDGTIVRERDKQGLEFAPALLWAYPIRRDCTIEGYCFRWVAGIGANADRVLPFFGVEGSVGQNVGLTLGVTLTERTRLRGEYTIGQAVGSDLEGGSLVQDRLDAALFLGITMRFDKSPFGG